MKDTDAYHIMELWESHIINERPAHSDEVRNMVANLISSYQEKEYGTAEIDNFLNSYKGIIGKETYDELYRKVFGDVQINGVQNYDEPYAPIEDEDDDGNEDLDYFEDEIINAIMFIANDIAINDHKKRVELVIDAGQGYGSIVVVSIHDALEKEFVTKLETSRVFYHVTKLANKENIDRNGLVPKGSRESSISYTPRTFLLDKLPATDEELYDFGATIQGTPGVSMSGPSSDYHDALALYKVTVPAGYNIYEDLDYSDSYFVDKKIPARAVEFMKTLEYDGPSEPNSTKVNDNHSTFKQFFNK